MIDNVFVNSTKTKYDIVDKSQEKHAVIFLTCIVQSMDPLDKAGKPRTKSCRK